MATKKKTTKKTVKKTNAKKTKKAVETKKKKKVVAKKPSSKKTAKRTVEKKSKESVKVKQLYRIGGAGEYWRELAKGINKAIKDDNKSIAYYDDNFGIRVKVVKKGVVAVEAGFNDSWKEKLVPGGWKVKEYEVNHKKLVSESEGVTDIGYEEDLDDDDDDDYEDDEDDDDEYEDDDD